MLNSILSIIFGGAGGLVLAWLLRGWISERLKQSIAHEYSIRLQEHRTHLEARLNELRHQYEINRLRTSLFFDHQRAAFAQLLAKTAEINQQWWREGYDMDAGELIHPVPPEPYKTLKNLYFEHQLFLDSDCLMAMDLLFNLYQDSYQYEQHDDSGPITHDASCAYENVEYLQPRLAALFQQKIGVASNSAATSQIALLGGIRILNEYRFKEIGLPVAGDLRLAKPYRAAEAVMRAEKHKDELTKKLLQLREYLATRTSFYPEEQINVERYLAALAPSHKSTQALTL